MISEAERTKVIEAKQEWLRHFEDLANTLKTEAGKIFINEIINKINFKNKDLVAVSLQALEYPYYEYSKDDLQKMKALRAQIGALEELKEELDADKLLEKAISLRHEVDALLKGEPLEPAY